MSRARCECWGKVHHNPKLAHPPVKRSQQRCTRTATVRLRVGADGPWYRYCEQCCAAIWDYQRRLGGKSLEMAGGVE